MKTYSRSGQGRSWFGLTGFVLWLLVSGGCVSPPDSDPNAFAKKEPKTQKAKPEEVFPDIVPAESRVQTIGASVEGRPVDAWYFGSGAETVLIVATIHGDEPAGTPLVNRLMEELQAKPERLRERRVVIVPVANPDGLAASTRGNANGVDLNRNFPAANFSASSRRGQAALSEPESRALHDLFQGLKPIRVISLHQPLNCLDYDGPADELVLAMAKRVDLPIRKLGTRPGSMGAFVGVDHLTPIVTVEFPKQASNWSEDELWSQYGEMMLASITH